MVDIDAQRDAKRRLQEIAASRRAVTVARQRLQRAIANRRAATAAEPAAVRAALAAGMSQVDIAAVLERSREHVRLILNPGARKTGTYSRVAR